MRKLEIKFNTNASLCLNIKEILAGKIERKLMQIRRINFTLANLLIKHSFSFLMDLFNALCQKHV